MVRKIMAIFALGLAVLTTAPMAANAAAPTMMRVAGGGTLSSSLGPVEYYVNCTYRGGAGSYYMYLRDADGNVICGVDTSTGSLNWNGAWVTLTVPGTWQGGTASIAITIVPTSRRNISFISIKATPVTGSVGRAGRQSSGFLYMFVE